jgi:hypothetical protein
MSETNVDLKIAVEDNAAMHPMRREVLDIIQGVFDYPVVKSDPKQAPALITDLIIRWHLVQLERQSPGPEKRVALFIAALLGYDQITPEIIEIAVAAVRRATTDGATVTFPMGGRFPAPLVRTFANHEARRLLEVRGA